MTDQIITDIKILHQISQPTTKEEVEKLDLKNRLKTAMAGAWCQGLGLAAIQIGVPLQYAFYRLPKHGQENFKDPEWDEFELFNTKIVERSEPFFYKKEGCLSIPNHWAETKRYLELIVENNGRTCSSSRLEALVIQHEVDHFNGVLVTDIEIDRYHGTGRNEPCPCLSGKKYKHCHLR